MLTANCFKFGGNLNAKARKRFYSPGETPVPKPIFLTQRLSIILVSVNLGNQRDACSRQQAQRKPLKMYKNALRKPLLKGPPRHPGNTGEQYLKGYLYRAAGTLQECRLRGGVNFPLALTLIQGSLQSRRPLTFWLKADKGEDWCSGKG